MLTDEYFDFEEIEQEEKPFTITDDKAAEWAINQIKQAQNDTEKWKNHYNAQMEAIRQRNENTEAFFTAKLREYFATVPARETETQAKYSLPTANLVRKKQDPEYIRDDEVLTRFLQDNDLDCYVEMKPRAKWKELKANCTRLEDGRLVEASTGLIVEGVIAEERPDKFEVKIK